MVSEVNLQYIKHLLGELKPLLNQVHKHSIASLKLKTFQMAILAEIHRAGYSKGRDTVIKEIFGETSLSSETESIYSLYHIAMRSSSLNKIDDASGRCVDYSMQVDNEISATRKIGLLRDAITQKNKKRSKRATGIYLQTREKIITLIDNLNIPYNYTPKVITGLLQIPTADSELLSSEVKKHRNMLVQRRLKNRRQEPSDISKPRSLKPYEQNTNSPRQQHYLDEAQADTNDVLAQERPVPYDSGIRIQDGHSDARMPLIVDFSEFSIDDIDESTLFDSTVQYVPGLAYLQTVLTTSFDEDAVRQGVTEFAPPISRDYTLK